MIAFAEPATPVVTKAFMRQIASGKVKAADLVDPTTGVLVVIYAGGVESEHPPIKTAQRLCGAEAERAIKRVVRDHLKMAVQLEDEFKCSNRPRPTCIATIAGEFGTRNQYEFRPTPDGDLVLDTLITTNAAYPAPNEAKVVARLRASQLGGTCE